MEPCDCENQAKPHLWALSGEAAQSNVLAALAHCKLLSLKLKAWAILVWECHCFLLFPLFAYISNTSIMNMDYLIN